MTTPNDGSGRDIVEGLEMLERLRDQGLISEEELTTRKAALLAEVQHGTPPPAPADAPPGLAWTPPGASPWAPPPPPPREPYPMRFDVEYPEHLSRWKTLIRGLLLIPVGLAVLLVSVFLAFGMLIGWMTVFWRKKYPDWLYRGMAGAFGFSARFSAYSLLVTDKFPSFGSDDSPVTLEFDEPPSGQLSRWRVVFWKSVLLIPHNIVLSLLQYALYAVTVIAWFAILFTGRYPRGIFQFTVGVQRWYWRTVSYMVSFNDRFPPYALSADAGPASNASTVTNGVIGAVIAAAYVGLFATTAAISNNSYTVDNLDYARVQSGQVQPERGFGVGLGDDEVKLRLTRAVDPGNALVEVIRPSPTERVIVFQWTIVNDTASGALVTRDAAWLKYEFEDAGETKSKSITAAVIGVNNLAAPAKVRAFGTATVQGVFVVPSDAEVLELRFRHGFADGGVRYVFD